MVEFVRRHINRKPTPPPQPPAAVARVEPVGLPASASPLRRPAGQELPMT